MFEVKRDAARYVCIEMQSQPKYGIVGLKGDSIFCFLCRKNLCTHAQFISRLHDKDVSMYPSVVEQLLNQYAQASAKKRVIRGSRVISHQKIQFQGSAELSDILNDHLNSLPRDSEGFLQLLPVEEKCCCGSQLQDGDPVANGWIAYSESDVITNSQILKAKGNYEIIHMYVALF